MLKTCLLLAAISAASTLSMRAAAIVTCSQPGYSDIVSNGVCQSGGVGDVLQLYGSTSSFLSGNYFNARASAFLLSVPKENPGPYPMTATAVWNDIFNVPVSNPTDVLKITVYGGGLNHPAFIDAGPIVYTASDFCDAHYTGNPACTETATVSGSQLLTVQLEGTDTVEIGGPCGSSNCGFSANGDLTEFVSVQQFLANGVTPDPFTSAPEPASIALLLLGIPAGFGLLRRRDT
jgi:hypothetical protein